MEKRKSRKDIVAPTCPYPMPSHKQLKIIISDASVPGEGEHKIMDWIRRERSYPEYDPNTSHVIYGLVSVKLSKPMTA